VSHDPAPSQLSFSVSGHIAKTCTQVYEAVADPEQLSAYFTTGGAKGRLETGATVSWDFHDFPGAFPVKVLEAEVPRRIVLQWEANHSAAPEAQNTVTFDFQPQDDNSRTKVVITESAWQDTAEGATAAFGNCEGWTGMLAAMKCWLEYGIVLREGFYK